MEEIRRIPTGENTKLRPALAVCVFVISLVIVADLVYSTTTGAQSLAKVIFEAEVVLAVGISISVAGVLLWVATSTRAVSLTQTGIELESRVTIRRVPWGALESYSVSRAPFGGVGFSRKTTSGPIRAMPDDFVVSWGQATAILSDPRCPRIQLPSSMPRDLRR